MTGGEQRILARGVAAGTIIGLAIGLMIALFIAMKPELFAGRSMALGVTFVGGLVVALSLILGALRAKASQR
jgi:uncharacterized membrane protein YccC